MTRHLNTSVLFFTPVLVQCFEKPPFAINAPCGPCILCTSRTNYDSTLCRLLISSFRGISFQLFDIFPILILILVPCFSATKIPASEEIFKEFILLFSSKSNLATHLVPFPHASARSPLGLKISIATSEFLSLLWPIVITWSHPAPVLRSANFLIRLSLILIFF